MTLEGPVLSADNERRAHQLTLLCGIDIAFGVVLTLLGLGVGGPLAGTGRMMNMLVWQAFLIVVIVMIMRRKNWARRLYLVLCLPMLIFAPALLFPAFPQMKYLASPTYPQLAWSISSMNVLFTLGFVIFLLMQGNRRLFTDKPVEPVLRVLLTAGATAFFGMGLVIAVTLNTIASYLSVEGTRIGLTAKGQAHFGTFIEKERTKAEAQLGMSLPASRLFFSSDKDAGPAKIVIMPETDFNNWQVGFLVAAPDAGQISPLDAWDEAMKSNPKWHSQIPISAAETSVTWAGRPIPATRFVFGTAQQPIHVLSFLMPGKNIYVYVGQRKPDDARLQNLIDDLAKA